MNTGRETRFPGLIALFGLVLFLPGIRWGLPAVVSWSQDTIAGVRTLGAMDAWPQRWTGRYPPLQYIVLRVAYQPLIWHWQRTGRMSVDPNGGRIFQPPHAPKIGALILVARFVTVGMAVGALVALWFATKVLTNEPVAAGVGSMAFGCGAAFTYFSHLGNVDVPSLFWFTISLIFYFRAIATRSIRDAVLLGFFGSLCISTKDNWAGMYPGMAVVLLACEWRFHRASFGAGRAAFRAVLQWRWFAGLLVFFVPYYLLNGVYWDQKAWISRISALADAVEKAQYRQPDPISLAVETALQAAGAVGWPMLAGMAAASIFAIAAAPRLAFILLVPCLSYYLLVISWIRFVYERFLLAPLVLGCVLVGIAVAAWLRHERTPMALRLALPSLVLLPTLGYAIAVDAEMITDSRYAAEAWFSNNVPRTSSIGALTGNLERLSPQYLPRLHELGYATFPVLAQRDSFERPQPDYLILSQYDHDDFDERQKDCVRDLLSAELGYEFVIAFRGRFLGTGSSWLSLAGWHAPPPGKISPTITVFRRFNGPPG